MYREAYKCYWQMYTAYKKEGNRKLADYYHDRMVDTKIKIMLNGSWHEKIRGILFGFVSYVTGYGKSILKFAFFITIIIVTFALTYWFFNLLSVQYGKAVHKANIIESLYFSGVTFIGLGDTKFYGNKEIADILIFLEGLLGVISFGLLIYIIGVFIERMNW